VSGKNRIQVLPPEEARRIAAGEVIDRPAALVREFLDNAIDSGAANIEVLVEGGGSKKIEVIDDGQGMGREDLELCWLTHATSKIRSLEDLNSAATLGFRGEALAAAAAAAELEILSSADGREAWRLAVGPGESHPPILEQSRRVKGSSVRALGLYDSIPARKRFLKREGSEANLCRQAFLDKALAFQEISFRYIQDGRLRDFFPPAQSKKERFAAAVLSAAEAPFLHEIAVSGSGFSASVVIGGPELYRGDKRQLYVFANGRRIQDYGLVQAMEYGTQGWFPNGTHPLGAVFIYIDPALADFNIHPAKREARFRDGGAIHQAVSAGLRSFCRRFSLSRGLGAAGSAEGYNEISANEGGAPELFSQGSSGAGRYGGHGGGGIAANGTFAARGGTAPALAMEALLEKREAFAPLPGKEIQGSISAVGEDAPLYGEPRCAGRVFGLFILVEWGEKLFIIDQHAAHERILYDRFLSGPIPKQELLVPIPFSAESDDDHSFLAAKGEELSRLGVEIREDGADWRIEALPSGWRMGDAETVKEILALRGAGENMAERWAATLCCHQAVRDGDWLDDASAFALARQALDLKDPHCPHGRPVWTEISREALYRAVKRT
jgi:DNA mismatch repair protein MutL